MLIEGNRIENEDHVGVTRIGPQGHSPRRPARVPELLRGVLTPFCGNFLQLTRAMLVLTRVENHLSETVEIVGQVGKEFELSIPLQLDFVLNP
jgi:hypothetical protein